jgi:zinc/manganese transport system substrate-binding protein
MVCLWLSALAIGVLASGCGGGGATADAGRLRVVAAESMWGSIAAQLGGHLVAESDIIANPAADPHDYEPTAGDARTLASAQLAIVNGAGYDAWASKLVSAGGDGGQSVLDVGRLVGVADGGNPHLWYSPASVLRVVDAVAARYAQLDPAHAAAFRAQQRRFVQHGLAAYRSEILRIRQRFSGVAVGASESIFAPLAPALGLRLVTPAGFMNAISEGTDPAAADKATADEQIARRQIAVWVYNSQNPTPDVQRLTAAARANGIPVVTVTETPTPAGATFQAWQVRQLDALARALAEATGR